MNFAVPVMNVDMVVINVVKNDSNRSLSVAEAPLGTRSRNAKTSPAFTISFPSKRAFSSTGTHRGSSGTMSLGMTRFVSTLRMSALSLPIVMNSVMPATI